MSDMVDKVDRINYKRTLQQQGYSEADAERIVKANPQSTAHKVSQERLKSYRRKLRAYVKAGRKKH